MGGVDGTRRISSPRELIKMSCRRSICWKSTTVGRVLRWACAKRETSPIIRIKSFQSPPSPRPQPQAQELVLAIVPLIQTSIQGKACCGKDGRGDRKECGKVSPLQFSARALRLSCATLVAPVYPTDCRIRAFARSSIDAASPSGTTVAASGSRGGGSTGSRVRRRFVGRSANAIWLLWTRLPSPRVVVFFLCASGRR